jgi:hypothetical protein
MLALNDSSGFGKRILDQYVSEGWGSLSKRDLELLFFILLEKDGALDRCASNYEIARVLRVTESKVTALRKDAYARWRPLALELPAQVLARVFRTALTKSQLDQTMKYATERRMDEGFVPLLVEHPDDRAEVEHAIKAAGAIPVLERNREVVLIHYETLLEIAESLGLLEKDPRKIQREFRQLFSTQETLKDFMTTPVGDLTWDGARAALNDAGTIVIEGGLRGLLPNLMKVLIPSIP